MRRMLSGNSVWLVMLGPVPRQLGPYSQHVCQRYPCFHLKHLSIITGLIRFTASAR